MILLAKPYAISKLDSIDELKKIFPKSECDELNFILFSTSGIHGNYTTLEEIENSFNLGLSKSDDNYCDILTVLVIQPRLVSMIYGTIVIEKEDISYLKKLRESSKNAILSYFE